MNLLLEQYRALRAFNPETYLANKIQLVNSWLEQQNLDACVVGLSGGVDSAVVAGILNRCNLKHLDLLHVSYFHVGMTEEQAAQHRASYSAMCKARLWLLGQNGPASPFNATFSDVLPSGFDTEAFVPMLRSALFYARAATLRAGGFKPFVAGTVNQSEGGFLGFWGKYSDGACDVQIISDLHKSEVLQLARYLGVPEEIVARRPRGDLLTCQTDEELIGTTYDEIELAHTYHFDNEMTFEHSLSKENRIAYYAELDRIIPKLEQRTRDNVHKYRGQTFIHLGNPEWYHV